MAEQLSRTRLAGNGLMESFIGTELKKYPLKFGAKQNIVNKSFHLGIARVERSEGENILQLNIWTKLWIDIGP